MEISFENRKLPYLNTVMRQMQTQEQTQQVRLSDTMPDVDKVLAGWGQILLRGKEWRGNVVQVSGGVKAWVTYLPADGTPVQCVEAWMPFQMKWDIPDTDRDGVITVRPFLSSVDGRMLSDRKLLVRASVGLEMQAMVSAEAECYEPGELPEDVEQKKCTYYLRMPLEAGEKTFSLEEPLIIPETETPLKKVIRYNVQPTVTESKMVADKLVLRGKAAVQLLYMGEDEQLHSFNTDIPFSQYTQLEHTYESGAEATVCFALTDLDVEQDEQNKITLKLGITAQYLVCDEKEMSLIEDVYSPRRSTDLTKMQLRLPTVLENKKETFRVNLNLNCQDETVIDCVFYMDAPQIYREEDKICAELSGTYTVLTKNMDGQMDSRTGRWEENWSMPVSGDADVQVMAQTVGLSAASVAEGQGEIELETVTYSGQPLDVVSGVQLGELSELNPERPSLILRRSGEDSLWQIAKESGSTVDRIMKANNLQGEPKPEQLLLIPVV